MNVQYAELTEERRALLHRRLHEAESLQSEIRILRRLLLKMGGIELVAPPSADGVLRLLIDHGLIMSGPVIRKLMADSACHNNVSLLWALQKPKVVGIGTGYALSSDGLWRQHSWGVRRGGLVETTAPRDQYFGILLRGNRADCFAESNVS
jgi:hypothetical protein